MGATLEILCKACRKETLLRREPVYDGFRKTGEKLLCASCGHEYPSEADVPFRAARKASVFNEDDRPRKVNVFGEEEKRHTCRHCKNYLVNPFTQRCGLHFKEVQATDCCDDFEAKPDRKPML